MVRHCSWTTVYQLWRQSWSTCLFVSSSYFQQAVVCVGVNSALVELSITQCCWLLELISPLCLCLAFRAADALITQQVVSCVLCTYWSFVPTLFFFFCHRPQCTHLHFIRCVFSFLRPSLVMVQKPVSGVMVPCCLLHLQPVPYLPHPHPPSR